MSMLGFFRFNASTERKGEGREIETDKEREGKRERVRMRQIKREREGREGGGERDRVRTRQIKREKGRERDDIIYSPVRNEGRIVKSSSRYGPLLLFIWYLFIYTRFQLTAGEHYRHLLLL